MYFCSRYNVAIVMKATYDRDIISKNDEYITLAEDAGKYVNSEDAPGIMLVDLVPLRGCSPKIPERCIV